MTDSLDEQLQIVSRSPRRRLLLALLEDHTIAVDELEHRGPAVADGGRTDPVELHHNHLPKLVEAGYVAWDRDGGVVGRGPDFEAIEALLELLAANRYAVTPEARQ